MACDLLKLTAEIEDVRITCLEGHFGYIHFSADQEILCLIDPHHGHILGCRHADNFLEEHAEMTGTAVCHLGKFGNRKVLVIMFLNILADRFDQGIMNDVLFHRILPDDFIQHTFDQGT